MMVWNQAVTVSVMRVDGRRSNSASYALIAKFN